LSAWTPFTTINLLHLHFNLFRGVLQAANVELPPSAAHKDYEAGAPKVALGVRFEDFDMTEYIDLTASPPTDLFDRSREPVVECGSQESNVNGNVFGPPYRREFE